MLQLLVTANIVPSSLIPFTLMEVIFYSEIFVLERATRRHTPEEGVYIKAVKTSNPTLFYQALSLVEHKIVSYVTVISML
jgi:hypothetical protein